MARLTYGARKKLPKTAFALPGMKTAANPAGQGAYPIPDVTHARSALQRASMFASPAEQATIKRKVKAKFPAVAQAKPKKGKK